ncbi:MAG: class I tRNA ligase family protein [Anaeroplasmataceae bacterium]|nr:class I tRNA ligase family protein [Anaeroplasmataceae bacterium]
MNKDSSYWIKEWKTSKNFRVENDRIKPKSYLFSTFPKTNLFGFQDLNVRPLLVGDFFSRYQRMDGYNVLFPTGFDSIGLSSYMENKRHSNAINDDISTIFEEQMLSLGIGMDDQKTIDLKHEDFLTSLQLAFIELYELGYIQYGLIDVCQDKSGKKILDTYFNKKSLFPNKVKAFYLDISGIRESVLEKIDALPLENSLSQNLKNVFAPKKSLTIHFSVTNGAKLSYNFKEPEYIGGISFILLHPDYIDFTEYTLYEEYPAIELYLSEDNTNDFGVFTGSYAINPLTGKKIPIFISVKYDCPIYVANPYLNSEDRITAQEEGLPIIDVVQNGVFIESDFLNGLPVEEGRDLIMDQFVSADIGTYESYYSKDKILMSSLDSFGALLPFFIDNEEELHSLKNYLPFVLSSKFRPVLSDDIEVPGNMISGSINHIFSTGILSILSILYDNVGASSSIFSMDAIKNYQLWKGIEVLTIPQEEVYENIFVPLCFLSIIEKEKGVKLPPLFRKLELVSLTYDDEYHKITRSNNNLFDFSMLLKKYSGDACRMYFLSKPLHQDFIFNEAELASMKNLKKSIEEFYTKPFSEKDQLKASFKEFVNQCLKALEDKDIYHYVEGLTDFFKEELWNNDITYKQGLVLLKIIYPVCPFLAEDIYRDVFHGKYLISDDGWIL